MDLDKCDTKSYLFKSLVTSIEFVIDQFEISIPINYFFNENGKSKIRRDDDNTNSFIFLSDFFQFFLLKFDYHSKTISFIDKNIKGVIIIKEISPFIYTQLIVCNCVLLLLGIVLNVYSSK